MKKIFLVMMTLLFQVYAAENFSILPETEQSLQKFCYDCHDSEVQKGDVRLDNMSELKLQARLDLLNKVQEQLHFKEMPPKKKKQPAPAERSAMLAWVSKELAKHNASGLEEKLQKPEYGNYVDHEKLFSGEYAHLPAYTKDRRWLISEFIFEAKINDLIDYHKTRNIDGKTRPVFGDNGVGLGTRFGGNSLRQTLTNPFLLPKNTGVRDYDTTEISGGHLLTMISNAKKIAEYMTSEDVMRAHYPSMYKVMKKEIENKNILLSRKSFLEKFIKNVAEELYKDKNPSLLPKFVKLEIPDPPIKRDSKGNEWREDNIEVLNRYEQQDLDAIFLGLNVYKADDATYMKVVEKCEKDWFEFGIHKSRIKTRVEIMKAVFFNYRRDLIYKETKKRNLKTPKYTALSASEMEVIQKAILKHRKQGDTYTQIIDKCLKEWEEGFKSEVSNASETQEKLLVDTVNELYLKIFERFPSTDEQQEKLALANKFMKTLTKQEALCKLVETLLLSTELVYRHEFGQGTADRHGRRLLSPRDASYAIAYALTDNSPDPELRKAVEEGRFETKEDYRREITRMLQRRDLYYVIDESVQKTGFNSSITNIPIRKLRFFREFFGYTKAMTLFKDDARYGRGKYDDAKGRLVDEADMLIEYILKQDKNVFEELLTTEKFYVYHSGNNEHMQEASDRLKAIYDYFRKYDWENFTEEELYKHWPFIDKMKMRGTVFPNFINDTKRKKGWVRSFKTQMSSLVYRFGNGQKSAAPWNATPMHFSHKGNSSTRTGQQMRGESVGAFWNIDYANWEYPTVQPAKVAHRKGILTHPAWLIAHSLNVENDPVLRGKFIREKLLAGTIPDVPITVDAVVPEDPHKTLRQRLEKATSSEYCWNCHQRMNPLGVTFEIFDDFGRYRTEERLEHEENILKKADKKKGGFFEDSRPTYKTLPVDAKGVLQGSGDPALDGEVKDAFDLTERLAKSSRVRQSIIRHAFRYFMGRNESLSDSKTLIDAEKAYVDSRGSFDAVIVSLLTSDSFIYRKSLKEQ